MNQSSAKEGLTVFFQPCFSYSPLWEVFSLRRTRCWLLYDGQQCPVLQVDLPAPACQSAAASDIRHSRRDFVHHLVCGRYAPGDAAWLPYAFIRVFTVWCTDILSGTWRTMLAALPGLAHKVCACGMYHRCLYSASKYPSIMLSGLVAFVFDPIAGVMLAKLLNLVPQLLK